MNALLLAGLLCLAAPLRPVPVILDTDIGSDIDDTWALCMLLGSPEVDLKLVVTAFRNTPDKTRLVAKVLERCGRTDIPIGTGVKTEDGKLNQDTWIKDYTLEGYPGTVYVDGVQALIDAVHQAKDTITICVIGPQGNLASALKRDPSIAQKARIVSMAGSVHIGYNGKEGRQPEWNVRADVASARAVFAAPWAITIAPLDTCGTLILGGAGYARVAASDAPRAKTVMENYSIWTHRKRYPEDTSSVLFDTEAAYLVYAEAFLEMETIKLSIDDEGNTVPDEAKGRPVRCAMRWKNRDAFEDLLVQCLTGEGESAKQEP